MVDELDYIFVLKALNEIPFGVGRKLLIEFLQGKEGHESIKRNKLHILNSFGSLAYEKEEINSMIDNLLLNNMIELTSVNGNRFWKVMQLSSKGINEIKSPSLFKKKLSFKFKETKTQVTEEDKRLFDSLGTILKGSNDEQKKAVVCNKKNILCIAGAGSGKTTVLTKRIDFLVKYRSVDPKRILAITFTRKARQEMIKRLSEMGHQNEVMIETFNSFCEKILRKYNNIIYDKPVRVMNYRDKIMIINKALGSLNISMGRAINSYFSYAQKRSKTDEQLANIFLNDCFFVRDYFKFQNREITESAFEVEDKHKSAAQLIYGVCNYIESYMKKEGLRDFADQLLDAISFFESHKEFIPKFDNILIDEYQDVNSTQIKLVSILSPENLFCVGDPRQSIFGWRGSDIKYILNFKEKYKDSEIVTLTKNYRSTNHIVDFINTSIRDMGLLDLESSIKKEKDINLIKFDSENKEFNFVINEIAKSKIPKKEIFVLARTNRQLNELSQLMKIRNIKHVVRSDEIKRTAIAGENDVTLATIHAIKGLEAKLVFVIGCTSINFPCRGLEHPVIEMIKMTEYDKEEEERRLFYVALSRAKDTLYITYSGKSHTHFISSDMLDMINTSHKKESKVDNNFSVVRSNDIVTKLKEWRKGLSKELNIPAFMIMHDRTIIDIAVKEPLTIDDLGKIHGLGPIKLAKYGEEILRLVG